MRNEIMILAILLISIMIPAATAIQENPNFFENWQGVEIDRINGEFYTLGQKFDSVEEARRAIEKSQDTSASAISAPAYVPIQANQVQANQAPVIFDQVAEVRFAENVAFGGLAAIVLMVFVIARRR